MVDDVADGDEGRQPYLLQLSPQGEMQFGTTQAEVGPRRPRPHEPVGDGKIIAPLGPGRHLGLKVMLQRNAAYSS
ncbi:MAG: hypothetical protein ACM31L_20615 [Actinomycetota bacterium]